MELVGLCKFSSIAAESIARWKWVRLGGGKGRDGEILEQGKNGMGKDGMGKCYNWQGKAGTEQRRDGEKAAMGKYWHKEKTGWVRLGCESAITSRERPERRNAGMGKVWDRPP